MNSCRDDDGFVRRRNRRVMRHVRNCRRGIRHRAAVARAGRSEIRRQIHRHRRLQPVAAQAKQNLRMTAQPAHPGANRIRRTADLCRRQRRADAVHLVVAALRRPDVIRLRAVETSTRFQPRLLLRALRRPARRTPFERRVRHHIHARQRADFDVVDQTFARALQQRLQLVGCGSPVIQHAANFHRCPRSLGRFIAVRPVRRQPVVAARIDQFETAAAAIRPLAPAPAVAIRDLIHHDVIEVRRDDIAVRGERRVRHGERDAFAAVAQAAVEIAERVVRAQIWIPRQKTRGVAGDDEVAVRGNGCAGRKGETNAAGQAPAPEVRRTDTAIVQLDELIIALARDRAVHDLVDHDVANEETTIARPGRLCGELREARCAIRRAAG